MLNEIPAVMTTHQKFRRIIDDMMDSEYFANPNDAFLVLRSTLVTIRDRIPSAEAVHLGGQLTPLLRGFYFEDWQPNHPLKKFKTESAFLQEIKKNLRGHDEIDLEICVPVALKVILQSIDRGEAEDVLHALPGELRQIFS